CDNLSASDDGPPPWVNFGNKIQTSSQDSDFKSLGTKNKEVNKDNSEFDLQRQGAIAEATTGAVKKIFGGRVKQNVQPVILLKHTHTRKNQENVSKFVESQNKLTQREYQSYNQQNKRDYKQNSYNKSERFYNAVITAITDKTYAVKFKGYGNIEEVLKTDCLPVTASYNRQNYGNDQQNRRSDNGKPYSGSMEFRRSARNYK
ncbi:hypothetical protein NQ318_018015, partial [Aromia moschata]